MSGPDDARDGGILRVRHDRTAPYFVAAKEPFNDERLSWEASGVMGYLLGKPDDWEVRMKDLISRRKGGRDRMQRIVRELETYGYMIRERTQRKTGKFEWITHVYEAPQRAEKPEPLPGLPVTAEPATAEPLPANPFIYRVTNGLSNEQQNNERESSPAATPPSLSLEFTLAEFTTATANVRGIATIDLAEQHAALRDAYAAGHRPRPATPAGVQADACIWARRAVAYAAAHPPARSPAHEPTPDRRDAPPAGPPDDSGAAFQQSLAGLLERHGAGRARPGDGRPPALPAV